MAPEKKVHIRGVDYESVGEGYLAERELKKGAAGWLLLVGLGVAYVISGRAQPPPSCSPGPRGRVRGHSTGRSRSGVMGEVA